MSITTIPADAYANDALRVINDAQTLADDERASETRIDHLERALVRWASGDQGPVKRKKTGREAARMGMALITVLDRADAHRVRQGRDRVQVDDLHWALDPSRSASPPRGLALDESRRQWVERLIKFARDAAAKRQHAQLHALHVLELVTRYEEVASMFAKADELRFLRLSIEAALRRLPRADRAPTVKLGPDIADLIQRAQNEAALSPNLWVTRCMLIATCQETEGPVRNILSDLHTGACVLRGRTGAPAACARCGDLGPPSELRNRNGALYCERCAPKVGVANAAKFQVPLLDWIARLFR